VVMVVVGVVALGTRTMNSREAITLGRVKALARRGHRFVIPMSSPVTVII